MIDSQFQEAYNTLYAGKRIRLEFDYKVQVLKYVSGLRVFKSRQDAKMRALGFADISNALIQTIQELDNKYIVTLEFSRKEIIGFTPKFTVVDEMDNHG